MKRVAAITGTRADYGIYKPVLRKIEENPRLSLSLIVVGMHLSDEFGYTVKEIEEDGFKIDKKIDVLHTKDTKAAMASSIGRCIIEIASTLEKINPDVLLILGDRSEMLAGAVVATYMCIPIAHIHGGELSGNVDEPVRHAITKLAHIHFTATKESAERIIRMGEEPWRVHVVGAPSLDTILNEALIEPKELAKRHNLDLSLPIILVVQHPVITEAEDAANQIRETLEAIVELGYQTVLIYPNADAGGRSMIEVIRRYEKYPFIRAFRSLTHKEYLSFMRIASVMVGNSSSGIIEAPSFGLPFVNIGTRQRERQRAENVIDVNYDKEEIKAAIQRALYDQEFRERVRKCKNFYGDGKAGMRIANILSMIKIDKKLLEKRMTY
jgi:UDP-N-acetylglucosamine 2-epimerase (non-hydrolysing)/GDP/UDP-N,N'-diacetylbacillosamine 2-epimerase (hydrolysing)